MTVMTYTSLQADILDYLDRNNEALVAQVPNFISLGEIRCSREVKNLGLKTSATSNFIPGQATYLKPNRWLEVISMNFGTADSFSTTARQSVSGLRTITLSEAHNFLVGDSISVFNVGGSGYNGNFTVSDKTQYTVSYNSGVASEANTTDIGGTVSHPLNNRTAILPRSLEFCNEYWPDRTETDEPKYYADYNYDNWLIVPTPKIAAPFEVVYFQRPIPLSESNQTNWFTENARDLLLYASLLETAPYLKNDTRIPTWKDYYMQSVAAIKIENSQRINDGSIKRQEAQ